MIIYLALPQFVYACAVVFGFAMAGGMFYQVPLAESLAFSWLATGLYAVGWLTRSIT